MTKLEKVREIVKRWEEADLNTRDAMDEVRKIVGSPMRKAT